MSTLSASMALARRSRPAPSARRTAASCVRPAARTRRSPATFTHASASTRSTLPKSARKTRGYSMPIHTSEKGRTSGTSLTISGYLTARRAWMARSSARAASGVIPSRNRPSGWDHGVWTRVMREMSVWSGNQSSALTGMSSTAGAIPTTVAVIPSTRRLRPTSPGSASNAERQSRSESTTTGAAPARASSGSRVRPSSG